MNFVHLCIISLPLLLISKTIVQIVGWIEESE